MTEGTKRQEKRDYSCEMISVVVLLVLSALAHFWYIAMFAGIAIAVWGATTLVGQMVVSLYSSRLRTRQFEN